MAPDRGIEDGTSTSDVAPISSTVQSLALESDSPNTVQSHDPTLEAQSQPELPPHLSHDPSTNAKRTDPFQFGQRYLKDADDVFEYNAWDHVAPDEDHLTFAEEQYAKQRAAPVSAYDYKRFNDNPEKWWDLFYKQKSATFFKDRKWLVQEFPVLGDVCRADAGPKVVLEVGAGAGNTAFPVMRVNENPGLRVWAVDFSKKAVETMRGAEDYATIQEGGDGRKGEMRAEVWDVAGDELPEGMQEGMADVVVMIFIFSALSPKQWSRAVQNVCKVLKPGGEVLFRDYGRGDLAQVRFKAGRWMEENFYVRGDGTRVYFFDKDELESIWTGKRWSGVQDQQASEEDTEAKNLLVGDSVQRPRSTPDNVGTDDLSDGEKNKVRQIPVMEKDNDGQDGRASGIKSGDDDARATVPQFDILNLDVDRRLIVNRQRRIKMYRCWLQGRFQKPGSS